MRRTVGFLLVIFTLLTVFGGCGEKTAAEDPNASAGDITDTSSDDIPETPEEKTLPMPDVRPRPEYLEGEVEVSSPEVQAVIAVAKAYLARTTATQYEDSYMSRYIRWFDMFSQSPEYATSQSIYNTSCSPFVKDVFWQAWGVDLTESSVWTAAQIAKATKYSLWNYVPTKSETDAEKEVIKNEFLSTLIPGDVIALCHNGPSGHILIHVGNGYAIHATCHYSTGGGNYDHSKNMEKWEVDGSVEYIDVTKFFEEGNYYYFWEKEIWSILRPTDYIKDIKITEQTKLRMENLQEIYAEKISSHPVGITADIGDEITYGFYLRNDRTTEAILEIKDVVPNNTSYVSGAEKIDGNDLSWTVTLAPGEEKMICYTVKINEDENLRKSSIKSDKATIGGVYMPCTDVYITKVLTDDEQAKIKEACQNLDPEYEGDNLDLASYIYETAGLGAIEWNIDEVQNTLFTVSNREYALDPQSKYYAMVAPNIYGGHMMEKNDDTKGERTKNVRYNLMIGDIIVTQESGNIRTFLYAGDRQVVSLVVGGGKLFDTEVSYNVLMSVFGSEWFAVLRPAMIAK